MYSRIADEAAPLRPRRVIGIVGGLGPFAHIELERRLLAAAGSPDGEQEYPEWIVASIASAPDRTAAVLGQGPSPTPWLVRSLETLATCADFALIACVTAHAFLEEAQAQVRLPVLDLVELTLLEAARRCGADAKVGVLATTGALRSGIFPRAAAQLALRLELLSLLDLPSGEGLQEELLMRPIYGPLQDGQRAAGGIKCGGEQDPLTGVPHRDALTAAVRVLAGAGAACVAMACTEIGVSLGQAPIDAITLLDPLDLGARRAVSIARGELPLPGRR
jgi:aspartate racemase